MDKCNFYKKVVIDHAQDFRKLWNELNKIMHQGHESKLPPHQSDKSLADWFASYFNKKLLKICNSFVSSDGDTTLRPPANPPAFSAFSPVTEDEISKIISNSPTKSCSLDPWPTFW